MLKLQEIKVWNLKFHSETLDTIVQYVAERLNAGDKGLHLTGINPEQIVKAQSNSELAKAINSSDVVNIDGILAVVALRLKGYKIPERVASPDLMTQLLELANRNEQRVYLLGAEEYVVKKAVEVLMTKYSGMTICGWHNGFYKNEKAIVDEIELARPDYLFIALPSPRKETFIMKYKGLLNVGAFYGVGGAFDTIGGKCRRAPLLFQKIHLEWLWRVCQNPKQNGMRVLKYYPTFFKMIYGQGKKS